MKFTYGTDFEMFLKNTKTQEFVPICGLLGGTKSKPLPFEGHDGFFYQEDGVTAEFNTPVCSSPHEMVESVRKAIKIGTELVQKKLNKHHVLVPVSGAGFSRETLEGHPQAMVIGCDPDYQAYNEGKPRNVPDIKAFGSWRFAGFHVHVGYQKELVPEGLMALVLDQYLHRLPSYEARVRDQFYPRGIFRPKPYGVEYRGLGSCSLATLATVEQGLLEFERDMQSDFGGTLNSCIDNMREYARRAGMEPVVDALEVAEPQWEEEDEEDVA